MYDSFMAFLLPQTTPSFAVGSILATNPFQNNAFASASASAPVPPATIPTPVVRDADAPFNDPEADIIIRSHDLVDFRVLKVFLKRASPIFHDMFGLPNPGKSSKGTFSLDINITKDGVPVVDVTEDSKTLARLLTLIYPLEAEDPMPLGVLKELHALIEAAHKYQMETVIKRLRRWLLQPIFLQREPVRVFAIACRYKMEEEARTAAQATLEMPILKFPYVEELEYLPSRMLFELLKYHRECEETMRSMCKGSLSYEERRIFDTIVGIDKRLKDEIMTQVQLDIRF